MSPLPEEEIPKQKRRTWIWILVVALLACLAFCVISFGWLEYTDSGHSFQTRVAEEELNQTGD
jgi:predicted outer membrane lipoprotein